MQDIVDLVERSLDPGAADAFAQRVAGQAAELREAIAAGRYDNDQFAVGLEMEVYAVESGADSPPAGSDEEAGPGRTCRLAALPDEAFEGPANKELGVHNAELNTDPNVLDPDGLAAQATAIEDAFAAGRADAKAHGCDLVLDAMWTVPPEAGSYDYLAAVERYGDVTVAEHMQPDPRYVAIDNESLAYGGRSVGLSVPGFEREFPTILFESLATSIQPHLQIPSAAAFPDYYNAAIRTLGPVLALSTNSPFLPADLYGDVDPETVLNETDHELRIAAFEQSVGISEQSKVRVPCDIETATDAVDRVVADEVYAPFLREWLEDSPRETRADRYWEFAHKRSTYWRWLRCVVGGDPVGTGDERSLRIEYRPLPTQPTIRDVVGLQALVAGLIRGLVSAGHPLAELPWEAADESFYNAVADGLDADLAWLTADGERTTDHEEIFGELFAYARQGLRESGVPADAVERYLTPIEARWEAGVSPSDWKIARVRERLAEGQSFEGAVTAMQREYLRRSRESTSFAEWL
ncbi:MAG: hypothetical protein BRD23_03770 [Halobacteriales archaeon SW_9_67_25]|nr:MAG: hypothetical protein BRD23_03770 [Halobacteriales archaeon SW_9_67_25]